MTKIYHTKSGKSKDAINGLVEKFQTGNLSAVTTGIKFKVPDGFPSSSYSMRNIMLAYGQTDSIVLGSFNFWRKNGRIVQKGSKAAYIFAPMISKSESEDGEEETFVYGYRLIPVFPVETTEELEDFDGDPIQVPDLEPAELPPLIDVAEQLGMKVSWKPVPMDRWADYWAQGKRINMGTDSPAVFFHELGHALHDRVDNKFSERSKEFKEVVAEFGSAVMMDMYLGEDSSGNAWSYIKNWNDDPTEAVRQSLSMIQKMFSELEDLQQGE